MDLLTRRRAPVTLTAPGPNGKGTLTHVLRPDRLRRVSVSPKLAERYADALAKALEAGALIVPKTREADAPAPAPARAGRKRQKETTHGPNEEEPRSE